MNSSDLKNRIIVRDFTMSDILQQQDYFKNASDEYLHGLGVDPAMIRNMPDPTERMKAVLATPVKDRITHTFAVEVEGRLIGTVPVKGIKYGEIAEMHGHIFQFDDRRRGLASLVFFEVLKKTFNTFELKKLVCEPTATNIPINAFLNKMGLEVLATYDSVASGILRARTANRYEITREFYLKLLSSSN